MIWIMALIMISWIIIMISDVDTSSVACFIFFVLTSIFVLFMAISIPVEYFGSMGRIAEMQAFINEVKDCYEYTIDETKNLIITMPKIDSSGVVDLSALVYMGLASDVSSRIAELRDKVTTYNEDYRKFMIYNDNFFTDCFYAELPEDLMPINLKIKGGY